MLYRYLLFIRFALVNLVAGALLVGAYLQGWLDGAIDAYLAELSLFIFAVFVYGLMLCGAKIWRRSVELNDLMAGTLPPDSRAGRFLKTRSGSSSPTALSTSATLPMRWSCSA